MEVENPEKKRNGDIELLRIIFATIVVIHHFTGAFGFDFAQNGGVADEFLFIVTGMLMAKSSKGKNIEREQIPRASWEHIIRKIRVFYPYYIFSIIAQFVFLLIIDRISLYEATHRLLVSIPEVVIVSMNGIYYENAVFGGGGWFLSAMLIAIFFLYPVLRYNYEYATKVIFPIMGIIGTGTLFMNFHTLNTALSPMLNNMILSGTVRATAEIALGAFGFELAQEIGKKHCSKFVCFLLTFLKWFYFLVAIIYALSGYDNSLTAVVFLFILGGCVLSFSSNTYCITCNKAVFFAGKFSVSLFLTHCVVRTAAVKLIRGNISISKLLILLSISFALALSVMLMVNSIKKLSNIKSINSY